MPLLLFARKILCLLLLGSTLFACGQSAPETRPALTNPAFDRMLVGLLPFQTQLIGVQEAYNQRDSVVFLDARKREEYEISHIPHALWVGFGNDLDLSPIENLARDTPIVIYCSVGYRSDKVGRILTEKQGFEQVENLYGSIFEWANQGLPLENNQGLPTQRLHTYNKQWSQWVSDSALIQKVW